MDFFLKIADGKPAGHPTDRASLQALYPAGIPAEYERFVPAAPPIDLGVYEVIEKEPSYVFNGQIWTHDWGRRQLTADEKAAFIQDLKDQWAVNGFPSWTFLEKECRFVPPIQPPTDDAVYHWDEAAQQWLDGVDPDQP